MRRMLRVPSRAEMLAAIRDDQGMTLAEMILGIWLGLIISAMVVGVTIMTVRLASYGSHVQPALANPVLHGLGRSSSSIQAPPRCINPVDEPLRSQCLVIAEGTVSPQLAQIPSTATFTSHTHPAPLCWVTLPAADISASAAEDSRRLECWHFDSARGDLLLSTFYSTLSDASDRLSLETVAPSDWGIPLTRTVSADVVGVVWECYADGDARPECNAGDPVSVVEMYICLASNSRRALSTDARLSMCNDVHTGKFLTNPQGESLPALLLTPGRT